jgi:hypothetical protein
MPRFNHMVTLAFEVISDREDGEDVTPEMLRHALLRRMIGLDEDKAWEEACLPIEDTYEMEDA